MNPASLIIKKREGMGLSAAEIQWWVDAYVKGQVADYQMAAWAMAVCLKGMDSEEIAALTVAMTHSGKQLPRGSSGRPRLDKHSTGGLGDKVSLILAPLLASCDVDVPMISGRGLGITGGTLDKLESIPGFCVDFEPSETSQLLEQAGCFIISASPQIAPADRKLYALRDVTGTVESVALITASILSKKLAASLDALVMDIKVGSGAFMGDLAAAEKLANSICQTGQRAGLPTCALISDMNQPLGAAVGNAVEVNEALAVLEGRGPADVYELTIALAKAALLLHDSQRDSTTTQELLEEKLSSGSAREYFDRMVTAQRGSLTEPLPLATEYVVRSIHSGFVVAIDCQRLGQLVVDLGGGRRQVGDRIDHQVGIEILAKLGQSVDRDQPLAKLYARSDDLAIQQLLCDCFQISDQPITPPKLIYQELNDRSQGSVR